MYCSFYSAEVVALDKKVAYDIDIIALLNSKC